jgi:GTP-binding protein
VKSVSAEFWAAARKLEEIPRAQGREVALAGRSNVGKSSLLNRLVGRRKLARTSTTPGCTRGLAFYRVGTSKVLVDLPGYGWARRSSTERAAWKPLVEGYLATRRSLAGVLILVDVRRGRESDDEMLAEYLDALGRERLWVLTKVDKLRSGERARRMRTLERELGEPFVAVSSETGEGIEDLVRWIDRVTAGERS